VIKDHRPWQRVFLPTARIRPKSERDMVRYDEAKEPANTILLDEGGALPHSPFVPSIRVISLEPTRLCDPSRRSANGQIQELKKPKGSNHQHEQARNCRENYLVGEEALISIGTAASSAPFDSNRRV
jgi:hypothetical protein